MRVDTKNLTIAEVVAQKSTLIAAKKQTPIYLVPEVQQEIKTAKPGLLTKAMGEGDDPNKLKVSIIGNTALWCDSHMDVLAIGCYDKTIQEMGTRVPHLHDHRHTLEAKIGKTEKLYTEMMDVSAFGISSDVTRTQVLKMDSEVIRSWNPKLFDLYKDNAVDQHSIGMQYVRLELAVNDDEYKEEFEAWQRYYPQVINKDKIDNRGYFWWVNEIKLFEISAVLFGSNELTPTTAVGKNNVAPSELDTQQKDRSPSEPDTIGKKNRRGLM